MKRIYSIALTALAAVIIISGHSFAAMNEQITEDNALASVAQERKRAWQDYEIYKAQKAKSAKESIRPLSAPASLPDSGYVKRKNDIFIGIGLIIVAIILTIWLLRYSKKEQS